jgi:hypothetical protein
MDLKVYPNPADTYLIVETGYDMPSGFKLFDALGIIVIQADINDNDTIAIGHLEPGMYQYKLISGSRLQVGKLKVVRTS